MKNLILYLLLALNVIHVALGQIEINPQHPKAEKLSSIMQQLTDNGVPGASIAILDADGWWTYSSGFSSLEQKTRMTDDHLHYLQSIAKTYMAVAVLKLFEEGKLNLEDPMNKHLDPTVSKMIPRADEITIKMLLNHTSGLSEYNFNPEYASTLLQHPETPFAPTDYVRLIKGKKLDFEPGSKYSYRNTNYVVLALIVDHITGDHGNYLEKVVFEPLGLQHTYYEIKNKKLTGEILPDSYWDRYSDGILENVSFIQRQNVAYMVGDDGIVTTTKEAILFLKGLMEGKLLKESTMELMKTWVNGRDQKPAYGLGLGHSDLAGNIAYGHSGGGLGAGCDLKFFPEKNLYMFVAINIGTVTESPIHANLEKSHEQLFIALLTD